MPDESELYGHKYTHLENDPYVTIIPITQPFRKTPGSQVLSRFCSTFSSVPAPAPAGVGHRQKGEKRDLGWRAVRPEVGSWCC